MEVRHPSEPGCRHNPGRGRQASELPRGRQARQCGDSETGRGGWAHTAGERSKTTSSNTPPPRRSHEDGKTQLHKGPTLLKTAPIALRLERREVGSWPHQPHSPMMTALSRFHYSLPGPHPQPLLRAPECNFTSRELATDDGTPADACPSGANQVHRSETSRGWSWALELGVGVVPGPAPQDSCYRAKAVRQDLQVCGKAGLQREQVRQRQEMMQLGHRGHRGRVA